MEQFFSFHSNWKMVHLQDICKIQTGKKDVDEGNPVGNYPFFTCASIPTKSDIYSFDGESILLPGNGANVGQSHYFNGKFEAYQRTYVLNQFSANAKYIFYYFQGFWRKHLEGKQYGSAINYVRMGNFTSFQIPIPTLPEQERIVAKIEELFTQLDAGTAALRRVQAELKHYKASVLKAAVTGILIGETNGKAEGELPSGWVKVKLSEVAEVRLGRQRSPSRATGPNMNYYLRAANVTWKGLDFTDVKQMDFSPKEVETYRLKVNDILLNEASGSIGEVGKPAIYMGQIKDCCFQNTILRVRTKGPLPEYLYYHFLYDASSERFREIARGVGIHHLGAEGLSNWCVSLPPIAQQKTIVQEIGRHLSLADQLEKSIHQSLHRAVRLRQAILKRAFEGKLITNRGSESMISEALESVHSPNPPN